MRADLALCDRLLRSLLPIAAVATSPTAYWPTGTGECPCIDPWASSIELNSNQPPATVKGCDIVRTGDRHCFDAAYGSQGCSDYDLSASPECGALVTTKPTWCTSLWCYVDPDQCAHTLHASSYFNATVVRCGDGSSAPLSFSYNGCGYVDTFTDSADAFLADLLGAAASNPSGKLRVAFPGDSASLYTLVGGSKLYPDGTPKVVPGEGVGGTNRSGSIPVFLDAIFAELGVPWHEIAITERSREYSPTSSFTACVHDVAIGQVDMCWGNFWPTATRRKLASFSSAIYQDSFHVFVPLSSKDESWGAAFGRPFAPFSLELWLMIFAILGVVGVMMTREVAFAAHGKPLGWCEMLQKVPIAVFKGWHGLNTGEIKGLDIQTSGGWLSQYAVGFTKTVVLAGYTSVVVSTLMTQGTTEVSTFNEAVRAGFRFCCNENMFPGLTSQYPDLAPLLVAVPMSEVIDVMDEGRCDATIAHWDQWYGERLWSDTTHCDSKARLVETITTVGNAIPVRDSLQEAVSWAISRALEAGEYAPLVSEARLNYTAGLCKEADLTSTKRQLGTRDLGAPLIFLLIVATISLFLSRLGNAIEKKSAQAKAAIDVDGDGEVSKAEIVAYWLKSISRPGRGGDRVGTTAEAVSVKAVGGTRRWQARATRRVYVTPKNESGIYKRS